MRIIVLFCIAFVFISKRILLYAKNRFNFVGFLVALELGAFLLFSGHV